MCEGIHWQGCSPRSSWLPLGDHGHGRGAQCCNVSPRRQLRINVFRKNTAWGVIHRESFRFTAPALLAGMCVPLQGPRAGFPVTTSCRRGGQGTRAPSPEQMLPLFT